jgi:hypothetical protein
LPHPSPRISCILQYNKAKGTSGSKFYYEGEEINAGDTLEDLGIDDGAELTAMVPQTGGR